MEDMCYLIDHD